MALAFRSTRSISYSTDLRVPDLAPVKVGTVKSELTTPAPKARRISAWLSQQELQMDGFGCDRPDIEDKSACNRLSLNQAVLWSAASRPIRTDFAQPSGHTARVPASGHTRLGGVRAECRVRSRQRD